MWNNNLLSQGIVFLFVGWSLCQQGPYLQTFLDSSSATSRYSSQDFDYLLEHAWTWPIYRWSRLTSQNAGFPIAVDVYFYRLVVMVTSWPPWPWQDTEMTGMLGLDEMRDLLHQDAAHITGWWEWGMVTKGEAESTGHQVDIHMQVIWYIYIYVFIIYIYI